MQTTEAEDGRGRGRVPNFLLIGAAKAGTTSLWSALAQHPEVFVPQQKEPNYFAFAGQIPAGPGPAAPRVLHELLYKFSVTEWSQYLELFAGATVEKAVGEASVRYLYVPEAAGRIQERLPGVRLLVVLREPVERLYSHYCMNRQFQIEPLDLEQAVAAEPERRRRGWGYDWHYTAVGLYADQLQRYIDRFGRERVSVHLYEDLRDDPLRVYRDVCRFLDVDEAFVPDLSARRKEAYRPRILALDRWLHHPGPVRVLMRRLLPEPAFHAVTGRLRRWNAAPVPPLSPERHAALKPRFRSDVLRLQELLGRDLAAWM